MTLLCVIKKLIVYSCVVDAWFCRWPLRSSTRPSWMPSTWRRSTEKCRSWKCWTTPTLLSSTRWVSGFIVCSAASFECQMGTKRLIFFDVLISSFYFDLDYSMAWFFFLVSGAFYVSPKRKYLLIVIPLCCNAVKISGLVSFFFFKLSVCLPLDKPWSRVFPEIYFCLECLDLTFSLTHPIPISCDLSQTL